MGIKGIIARDNTHWQEDFAAAVAKNGYGVMWKDQFSYMDEVIPELNHLIEEKGFFEYYNIAKNVTDFRMEIVDFATKDTYDVKKKEWEQKDPAWYHDSFGKYSDKKQKAKIAFLVRSVEKINSEERISINDFITYKGKQASVKNAVAYLKIITENDMDMINISDLLTANHNLILNGAPGTGKTYIAKQIAQQMIFGEVKEKMTDKELKQFNEQCGFVQFHPSYDYTDFVEGLRPVASQNEDESIGFERKNGVFKDFCINALEKIDIKSFDESFDSLLDFLVDGKKVVIKTSKGSDFAVSVNSKGNLKLLTGVNQQGNGVLTREKIKAEFKGIENKYWKSYYKGVVNYLEKNFNLKKVSVDSNRKFVFIIDEINRGEISKIFGELFFSIDPSYRGTDGKVRTQYANMQTEPNEFDAALKITDTNNYGHFFVPENVYIIGTMNDIDRSVESMDFAFRRRFAFKEITAIDSQEMLGSEKAWGKDEKGKPRKPKQEIIDDIVERMNAVNHVIWHKAIDGEKEEEKSIEGLSSAYHIGASYFLKLVNYKNHDGSFDFDKLWEYHLEGLLFEYLRGTTEMAKKLKKLAEAYGYTKADKYE